MRLTFILTCIFLYLFLNSGYCNENNKKTILEKVLPDGDIISLQKQVTTKHIKITKDLLKDIPKDWKDWKVYTEYTVFTYTLTLLKSKAEPEEIWEKKLMEVTEFLPQPIGERGQRFKFLDININNDNIIILYTKQGDIKLDKLKRNDKGNWIIFQTLFISEEEIGSSDKIAISGQLIPYKSLLYTTLEYLDKTAECWMINEEGPRLMLKSEVDSKDYKDWKDWLEKHSTKSQDDSKTKHDDLQTKKVVDSDKQKNDNSQPNIILILLITIGLIILITSLIIIFRK